MIRQIFVTYTAVGFHYWEGAQGKRSYLRNKHRHLFHVKIKCPVEHNDRDIEFHDLLDYAKSHFDGGDMGPMSCEMIAEELAYKLVKHYDRPFSVEVSEDGECGAHIVLTEEVK